MAVAGVTNFKNLPTTTVSSGGTDAPASGTTEAFTVASSAGWPAAASSGTPPTGFSFADANLPGEVMRCANLSGTSWTVTRGAEGTTPVAHQAGFTIVQVTSAGDLTAASRVDWLNAVTQFGADPTGVADSTTAINTALSDAATGQPVYLPTGIYQTSAPLIIPPGGVLLGDFAGEVSTELDFLMGTVIQPSATWSNSAAAWNGVIVMLGQSDGGYATTSEEQKIWGLQLDCHLMTNIETDGVQLYGGVGRVHLERVNIDMAPNNGFNTVTDGGGSGPGSFHLYRVNVRYAGSSASAPTGYGFWIDKTSDITCLDCLAENCSGDGFNIVNLSNGQMIGCRSEHNGSGSGGGNGYTYTCTNSSTGSGTGLFVGCSTDNNNNNGWEITSTNNSGVPVQLAGCRARRDGTNGGAGGGSSAGIYITAYPGTVQISGTSVFPGVEDSGSGPNVPQIGLRIHSNSGSGNVLVSGSYIQGATTAIADDATSNAVLYDLATLAATGGTGSATVRGPRQGTAQLSSGSVTVATTAVTSSSNIYLTAGSTGANSGAIGVNSINPGVSFTVHSTNGADGNNFSWFISNP